MVPLNESQRAALTAIMSLWPDVEVILVGGRAGVEVTRAWARRLIHDLPDDRGR